MKLFFAEAGLVYTMRLAAKRQKVVSKGLLSFVQIKAYLKIQGR